MITLKQLRYLAALSTHRHFGRAAEACSVTQPALSMQIQELEAELGVDAGRAAAGRGGADRDRRRGGAPGRAGARRRRATSRTSPATARRLLTGRLRLGVIPSIAPYVLPKILPRAAAPLSRTAGRAARDA